jgi:putative ATP-dependent endonuclease of OLD family
MRIARLTIRNFRGIRDATLFLPKHGVLIGDNNTGKTSVLEALDLVLGPDRINRQPPIDEHDFFAGRYLPESVAVLDPSDLELQPAGAPVGVKPEAIAEAPKIEIEATITDLSVEQKGKFGEYAEFWDSASDSFYEDADPAGVDAEGITEALRVTFYGYYNKEEDDFEGRTFFTRSLSESDQPIAFGRRDKQIC